ncbi:hypothetical protein ACIBKY_32900 [Nonomuraea sp. NPDC050394]
MSAIAAVGHHNVGALAWAGRPVAVDLSVRRPPCENHARPK